MSDEMDRNYDTKGRRQDMRKDGRQSVNIKNHYHGPLECVGEHVTGLCRRRTLPDC
jgi:hypothetical protein